MKRFKQIFTRCEEIILEEKLSGVSKDQFALRKHLNDRIKNDLKIKIFKSSRKKIPHIRAPLGKTDAEVRDKINKLGRYLIQPAEIQISAKFPTFVITTLDDIRFGKKGLIHKGTEVYFVNNQETSGLIKKKETSPAGLGLGGMEITVSNYINIIMQRVNHVLSDRKQIIPFFEELLRKSATGQAVTKFDKSYEDISSSDIANLANDFGEITGAIWYAKVKKGTKIFFPSASNEPLIDYKVFIPVGKGKSKRLIWQDISAKAGAGASPSISGIISSLNNNPKLFLKDGKSVNEKYVKVKDFINAINNEGVVEGILSANRIMDSKGYKVVQKIIGTTLITESVIIDYMSKFTDWDTNLDPKKNAKFHLLKLYDVIGRKIKAEEARKLFAITRGLDPKTRGSRLMGYISAPLGYHIVDIVNQLPEFNNFLNDALRSIQIIQIYINITKRQISYKIKDFKESNFKWKYSGSAPNPKVKKIGFELKKK